MRRLAKDLEIPICCKIRIFPSEERTLKLCKQIEEAGCSILTVHGRTKEQNKHKVGDCDWAIIKKIKDSLKIPVFANGGVKTFEDVQACLKETGCDGVMSAEALLEYPALFSGKIHDLDDLALEYLDFWEKYDGFYKKPLKPHLFKILHEGLRNHVDLRKELGNSHTLEAYRTVVNKLKELRKDVKPEDKFGWYDRYRHYNLDVHNALKPSNDRKAQPKKDEANISDQAIKKVKTGE